MESFPPIALANTAQYLQMLGVFHSNWSAIDLYTDFAIFQFLNVTPEQAHLITSGMMFGRKARLLYDLLRHSNDQRKPKLLEAFNKIQAAKREIISHSYVKSDALSVTFLEKNISGSFKTKTHTYSANEFYDHVKTAADAATAFFAALGCNQDDINAFAEAAINLTNKSSTSPDSPLESK
jgi:hypothetical protein